jgi:Helix-turn-helix domain of resolvase
MEMRTMRPMTCRSSPAGRTGANLIRQRTREGMDIARQNGKLRGKQPSLKPAQDREIRRMHDSGDYNVAEIAVLFNISRPTVYRSLDRTADLPPLAADTRPAPDIAQYDQLLTSAPALRPGSPDHPGRGPRSYSGRPRSGSAHHLIARTEGSRYISYRHDNGAWLNAAEDYVLAPAIPGPSAGLDVR